MQRVSGISKGYVEFVMSILYYFREWQDSLERLLDSGVHCVHYSLTLYHLCQESTDSLQPPTTPPSYQSPSADNSQSHYENCENILRRM